MGAARDSSDDFGVELDWPEDELPGKARSGRAVPASPIDATSRPHRAELVRHRSRELPSGLPLDVGRAFEMLSDRIDVLADAVRGLQHVLADRFEDHRAQLISLRRRVARLDALDDVMAGLHRKSEALSGALVSRSGQQEELQRQLSKLTEDIQVLRRRMRVQAKDRPPALTEGQVEAVAQAILAGIRQEGAGSSGGERRSSGRTRRK